MMADNQRKKSDNPISEELETILNQLTSEQIRFVVARQSCTTMRQAAKEIGVNEDVAYRWPKIVERAVQLTAQNSVITALYLRRRALAKAMAIKAKGLDSKDERVRQSTATEIIEWELGKAKQSVEHSGDVNVNLADARERLEHLVNRAAASTTENDNSTEPDA